MARTLADTLEKRSISYAVAGDEAILRDQGKSFDRTYVRRALIEPVGEEDARLSALDELEDDVSV